eukprot:scaffold1973_cov399-Prasinococcus_capsulatus_cf.AAC.15
MGGASSVLPGVPAAGRRAPWILSTGRVQGMYHRSPLGGFSPNTFFERGIGLIDRGSSSGPHAPRLPAKRHPHDSNQTEPIAPLATVGDVAAGRGSGRQRPGWESAGRVMRRRLPGVAAPPLRDETTDALNPRELTYICPMGFAAHGAELWGRVR